MLVLNNLPNVQMLNGRSTKDDEDEEEDDEEKESNDNNENEDISGVNNHLYPQMEEIEEDKNMENNNSNYISVEDNNTLDNNNKDSIHGNKNDKNEAINDKISVPKLNIKNNNEGEAEGEAKNNTDLFNKIISDNSNKNLILVNDNNAKAEKTRKRESYFDFQDSDDENEFEIDNIDNKNIIDNYLIDITNEELNTLKDDKYNINSEFISIIKDFSDFFNNQENDDENKMENVYINKLKGIEKKKNYLPNYLYFHLLLNKKIKILKKLLDEIFPYIVKKLPEINKNNILIKIYNELLNAIKNSKELISALHKHIDSFNKKKNPKEKTDNTKNNNDDKNNSNDNKKDEANMNKIINEKNNRISLLQSQKEELLNKLKEDKNTYETKIASLEKENKIMTEKLLDKANSIINSPINEQRDNISLNPKNIKLNKNNIKPQTNINYRNHSQSPGKSRENTKFENYNKNKRNPNNNMNNNNKTRSPMKTTENTISFDNYYLNTNMNMNSIYMNSYANVNKQQLITLKTLKDFMNELYISKENYDMKCLDFKLPKETLEEHMYTFLNKKYGLKTLIIDWARNVINGIKYYSRKDSFVLLFGKIMRNEQEEEARFIIQKVAESIEELLLYYIKRQNPLKSVTEINKIFEKKKKSELFEEEWKGIIYSIYEKSEAEEIEKKLEIYINKENEKKKMEMFKKYKDSRLNKHNKYNNYVNTNYTHVNNNNNSYYLNTINSFNNGLNTSSSPNNNNLSYMKTINNPNNVNTKMSRVEKYNMLLFPDERNILYSDFIKIVLDNHIRFRDKQLKNFVELFKSVDTNRDGIINEEEFGELIQRMKIFKEDDVENKIFQFLEIIDPFDNQKITFSECVSFFSGEIIQDIDINGNEKEISILEKVCFNDDKNTNGNINELNENEPVNIINSKNNNNKVENNNEEI